MRISYELVARSATDVLKIKFPIPRGMITFQNGYLIRPAVIVIKSFEKGMNVPYRKQNNGKSRE